LVVVDLIEAGERGTQAAEYNSRSTRFPLLHSLTPHSTTTHPTKHQATTTNKQTNNSNNSNNGTQSDQTTHHLDDGQPLTLELLDDVLRPTGSADILNINDRRSGQEVIEPESIERIQELELLTPLILSSTTTTKVAIRNEPGPAALKLPP
jgi:hypothetical protein